jgi:indolepyruvate ferredoxin oxidoreductase
VSGAAAGLPLARAVATQLRKVMAYKDEYEVARLYTDGSFHAQLAREFESWERLEIQLAPQIANPRDPDTGRAKKRSLGPWMFPVLRVMARFKLLRGTPLDPFGWTAHRKMERQLVRDYVATVDALLTRLSPENRAQAVEIARIPELIRGFDLVKEKQLESAQAKQRELLDAFHRAG